MDIMNRQVRIVIMDTIHLSPRLKAILGLIPQSKCLADIGSDHAHLPLRAIQDHIVDTAIAGEVRRGPFQQSLKNVQDSGMQTVIDVRLGDGLDVLTKDEANSIVIAGMGGELIRDILERGKSKLGMDTVLILQPNIREYNVRQWLNDHGWTITDERIIEEEPHFYEIIQAKQKVVTGTLTETELLMGPVLLRRKDPTFIKKWRSREQKLINVLRALNKAGDTELIQHKKVKSETELKRIQDCIN
ncbi:tRNA (adenine(22)-N(1))-methyltransferase [Sporolactobacillus kofuensis]|uniref:tRNA (Adenine(22)-N(1))-methyltransferase n=1 Tax=Sporolactobacillus kofuensis TaxID=269672 RepID=A0ABW1W9S4_9BACL|nr:class I SAM-dependent methyltransferase [Sporolactobacillus kofuensis]MCO7175696.1 class I SAM-dependent methyltransferase [Sporolactobacillus kofuensis]